MLDNQFEVLTDPRRRRLLVGLLEDHPGDVQIPADVYEGDRDLEWLETEMVHKHLPKLEDAGFIHWNQDTQVAIRGPQFDEIRPLLELIDDHADELPADWP